MLCVVQHSWKTTTFLSVTLCSYCGEVIWGFSEQGVQCAKCSFPSHHKCKNKVVSSCHIAEPHPIRPHTFLPFKLRRPTFCNLCRTVITIINPGLKCDVCRYVVHPECADPAPKNCRNGLCSHLPHSTPPNSASPPPISSPPGPAPLSPAPSSSPPPPSSSVDPTHALSPPPVPPTHFTLQPHHWVEGNTPQKGVCEECGIGCSNIACLLNFRCAWCKRLAHATCLSKFHIECDGGVLNHSLILPKAAIAPVQPATVIELLEDELPSSPMFVFVNSKSGGQQGPRLLHKLRYLLNNAVQVFELIPNGPGPGLEVIRNYINSHHLNPDSDMHESTTNNDDESSSAISSNSNSNTNNNSNANNSNTNTTALPTSPLPTSPSSSSSNTLVPSSSKKGRLSKFSRKRKNKKGKTAEVGPEEYHGIRIVVCGGDGTAGWIVQAMAERAMSVPIAIIPLGTGNDLARTLGWGPGYSGENVLHLLQAINKAPLRTLDRWYTEFVSYSGKTESHTMTNYFSIGVDAKVALSFHLQREASPEQFKNRFVNFLWYTKFGASAMFDGCENLSQEIKLEVDGEDVEIPPKLQGLIIVNLPSYAAGLNMWRGDIPKGTQKQAIDDGLLEVVGVMGSGHLGQIQTGLSDCIKITQGKAFKISFVKHEGHYPVQVDGEPWSQESGTITLSQRDQVPVLFHQKRGEKKENQRNQEP